MGSHSYRGREGATANTRHTTGWLCLQPREREREGRMTGAGGDISDLFPVSGELTKH